MSRFRIFENCFTSIPNCILAIIHDGDDLDNYLLFKDNYNQDDDNWWNDQVDNDFENWTGIPSLKY